MNRVLVSGFGAGPDLFSSWPQKTGCVLAPNTTHSYPEILEALDRFSQKGPLDIFGWSMGSLFALKWAVEHPGLTRSLFLTGATARFCASDGYENGIESSKLREMARLLLKNRDGVMRAFFSSFLEDVPEASVILGKMMRQLPGPEVLLAGLAELDGIDLLDEVSVLKIPVRIVHGRKDRITPVFGAEELARRIPGAELSLVDGGHALFLEQTGMLEEDWIRWTP